MKNIFVTALISLVALVSCNQSSKGKEKRVTNQDDSILAKAACEYGWTDGEGYSLSFSQVQNATVEFSKALDFAKVNSILRSSLQNTYMFFNQDNRVRIVKTEKMTNTSCSPFGNIPNYNSFSGLSTIWKDVIGRTEEGSTILGLYKDQNPMVSGITDKGSIFVREDTTRWTLIHEYMHHLFESYRREYKGEKSYEMNAIYVKSVKAYNDAVSILKQQETIESLKRVAEAAIDMIKQDDRRLVNYTLEEITIEANLLKLHRTGYLQKVTNIDVYSAQSYIDSSATNAIESINESLQRIKNIQDALVANNINDYSADLNNLSKLLNERKSEATKIRNANPVSSIGLRENLLASDSEDEIKLHKNCAHSDLISKVNKLPLPKVEILH